MKYQDDWKVLVGFVVAVEIKMKLVNKYCAVLSITLASTTLANTDYLMTDVYQIEKDCVAGYSLARDIAFDSNKMELYRSLTTYQNELYLKYPSGYFPSMHIKVAKILHKQRASEQGSTYLSDFLIKCGFSKSLLK